MTRPTLTPAPPLDGRPRGQDGAGAPARAECIEDGCKNKPMRLSFWCAYHDAVNAGTAQLYGPLPLFEDGAP